MKQNFYLMNWYIRILKNTKLILFYTILIGFCTFLNQVKVYSQITSNCKVVLDTTYEFEADSLFPDWNSKGYKKVKVKHTEHGGGIFVSMDFIINQEDSWDNSNGYTSNQFIGVDNESMLEFTRLDLAYKFMQTLECPEFISWGSSDTITITILQKTPCWKARYCRIPLDSFMCCNDDGDYPPSLDSSSYPSNWINYTNMPGYELIHQGGEYTDSLGNKFFYINTGKSQCGWKCCELKYKFVCKYFEPEFPEYSNIYREFVGFERKEFENSSCIEDYEYSNPNCRHPQNFNPNNPCKGDCNENAF